MKSTTQSRLIGLKSHPSPRQSSFVCVCVVQIETKFGIYTGTQRNEMISIHVFKKQQLVDMLPVNHKFVLACI